MTWTSRRPRITGIRAISSHRPPEPRPESGWTRAWLAMGLALLAIASALVAGGIQPGTAKAASLVVNSSGDGTDAAPGDGACMTSSGLCTLRAAITEANALAGADTITFALGSGTPGVVPLSALPTLTGSTTIDGGTGGALRVELNGTLAGAGTRGLGMIAGTVVIRNMVINRFGGDGIAGSGTATVTIQGSLIGTDDTGNVDMGNGDDGIHLSQSGGVAVQGNIISGNTAAGVRLSPGTGASSITGNFIGVSNTGAIMLGNGWTGISSNASTFIGSNLISANGLGGVTLAGAGASGSVIQNNFIGTNGAGTADFGNGENGIEVTGGADGVTIGGPAPGNRNLISGNDISGIALESDGNVVEANIIGTAINGTSPLPNASGVYIDGSDNDLTDNLIASNTGDGVEMFGGSNNTYVANQIRGNGGLGVDLRGANGPDANDALDADSGTNGLQNYPVLSFAAIGDGSTHVSGTLSSTPSKTFKVYFYANSSCDPSGYGEGETYLGQFTATTNGSGSAVISATVAPAPGSSVITATAVRNAPSDGTSEFSQCVVLGCSSPDTDCDSVTDTSDNCTGVYNPTQANNDRNFIDLPPSKSFDDLTSANSDTLGDACDADDDNDGRTDANEATTCAGFPATNSMVADTDADRYLDAAECAIGTNPTSSTSKPTAAQCVTASGAANTGTDSDADGVKDYVEYCNYNTSSTAANTDGDVCSDGKEVASINADTVVNASDLAQVSQAFGSSLSANYIVDFDVNKDGAIGAVDLALVAQRFGPC